MTSRTSSRTRTGAALVAAGLAAGALWLVPSAGADDAEAAAPATAARALDGFSVTSSSPEVTVGDTFTLTVAATDVADLYAYDLGVAFDPTVLSYVEGSGATDLTGSTYDTVGAGRVGVVHTKLGSSPAASGPVALATLSFTAVSVGSTDVVADDLTMVTTGTDETTISDVGSVPVIVKARTAAVPTTRPVVSGTSRVGAVLTATPGTWDASGLVFGYQWLRGNSPIAGATAATYAARRPDVGELLAVRVTASAPDRVTGTATSGQTAPVTTAPGTVNTRLAGSAGAGALTKAKVRVTAPGLVAKGSLTVRYDGAVVTQERRLKNGKRVVFLPAKPAGRYRLVVVFQPATGFASDREVLRVRVRG